MRRSRATSLVIIVVVAVAWLTATLVGGNSPQLGLDLQGGASVVLTPTEDVDTGRLKQAQEIIRNRVDGLGVAEPDIHLEGQNIVVQLPGVKNATAALDLVGQTAELRFRPVLQTYPPELAAAITPSTVPGETPTTIPGETTTTLPGETTTTVPGETTTTTAPAETSTSEQGLGAGLPEGESAAALLPEQTDSSTTSSTAAPDSSTTASTAPTSTDSTGSTTTTSFPPGQECGPTQSDPKVEEPEDPVTYPEKIDGKVVQCYVLGPTAISGQEVTDAKAVIPSGAWIVEVTFTDDGLTKLNETAAICSAQQPTCPQNQFAIVLDGVVASAPTFKTPSFDGNTITIDRGAGFPEGEAKDLALVLRYGALPVELEAQTVQTVSATLGKDSLRAGLIAGLVGISLVALYMILYYRALGIVVIFGVAVWSALNFSIITYLSKRSGLALSLAGVTGIIVSVGVTVDSYVVFFERLKDEIRSGKTIRSSVDRGFKRAFRTILAADISSFIGAFLLFWLTVGSVRGFAFFLGLSTVLDVIVAWMFTRPLVALLGRSRFFTEARWVGVARGLGRENAPVPAAAPAGGGR